MLRRLNSLYTVDGWLSGFVQDIHYSARQFARSRGISTVAMITLAVGVSAMTAVASIFSIVVLKSLPVSHPDGLVLYGLSRGEEMIGMPWQAFAALRSREHSCTSLFAWSDDHLVIRDDSHRERVAVQLLGEGAFKTLGLEPALGTAWANPSDLAASPTTQVVISYGYWTTQFARDPGVIGRAIYVNEHSAIVVGVAPKAFDGLTVGFHPSAYIPLSAYNLLHGRDSIRDPSAFVFYVLGRLEPHRSIDDAKTEASVLERFIRREADPDGRYMDGPFKPYKLTAQAGRNGLSWVKEAYGRPLVLTTILTGFLLILCCLNVTFIMLARVSGRAHEHSVRIALGVSRLRLVQQIFVETLLLSLPSSLVGALLGYALARRLASLLASRGNLSVALDPTYLCLAAGVCVFITIGAGSWPALKLAREDRPLDLRTYAVAVRPHRWIIFSQVLISASLVNASIFVGGALLHLLFQDPGFVTRDTVMATIDLSVSKTEHTNPGKLIKAILDDLRQRPGVVAGGYSSALPLSSYFISGHYFSRDADGTVHIGANIYTLSVSRGYFPAIGTVIFQNDGTDSTPIKTCFINRSTASLLFPQSAALGRTIYLSTTGQPDGTNLAPNKACHIGGIVENAKLLSLHASPPQVVYEVVDPATQDNPQFVIIARGVRLDTVMSALVSATTQDLPVDAAIKLQTFAERQNVDLSRDQLLTSLAVSCGALGMLLMALGQYGVLSHQVSRRYKEIGILLALGSPKKAILWAIVKRPLAELLGGLLASLFLTWMLARAIMTITTVQWQEVGLGVLLGVGSTVIISVTATWVPVRKAIAVNPMQALRAE